MRERAAARADGADSPWRALAWLAGASHEGECRRTYADLQLAVAYLHPTSATAPAFSLEVGVVRFAPVSSASPPPPQAAPCRLP